MKVVKTIRSWNLPLEGLLTQNKNTKTKGKKMETIDDIVRDMRIGDIRATANTSSAVERKAFVYINDFLAGYADRIEQAITNCNRLKMREAVVETEKRIDKVVSILTEIPDSCGYGGLLEDAADELCDLKEEFVKPVLAEPPRNCDIGSLEEQEERYVNFCHNYPKCTGCPCVGRVKYNKCEFVWLQMPYVEAKGEGEK